MRFGEIVRSLDKTESRYASQQQTNVYPADDMPSADASDNGEYVRVVDIGVLASVLLIISNLNV